ncbi:MAG: ATP-binding protein [Micrococcaceae bacterium]
MYDSLDKNKQYYIFIDEVQEVEGFERLVRGLFVEKNIDLYVTGSNAYLMSSELATLLTGRTIEIHILPFSFEEFKEGLASSDNSAEVLLTDNYLQESCLPEAVSIQNRGRDEVFNYVEGVVETILHRDVYPNIKEANRRVFENVYKYVLQNIGSEVSPNSIAKALKQDQVMVSHMTVSQYLDKLCDSFLLYRVHRFNIKGKVQLATQEKYYVPDLGIRHLLIGQHYMQDRGHLLENLVYFELLRRGGRIWVGKINANEVDFVVHKNTGEIEYYQVAYTMKDQKTANREFSSLMAIKDNYPKIIITADTFEGIQDGIHVKNITNWLPA